MNSKYLAITLGLAGLLGSAEDSLARNGNQVRAAVFPPEVVGPQPSVPSGFDIIGHIQAATLDQSNNICTPASPRLAGGTVVVNGLSITVPCNTFLQMPATSLTWADLFERNWQVIGTPAGTTGLALLDNFAGNVAVPGFPLPAYQIHVQGNIIANPNTGKEEYIAGLVFISQDALNAGQGYIKSIDYATGELCVSSTRPITGFTAQRVRSPLCTADHPGDATPARIRLNDPLGRFGLSHGKPGSNADVIEVNMDPRFTADLDNPTVHANTGYPMCIPRSFPFDPVDGDMDAKCPQANRPVQKGGVGCQNLPPANGKAKVNGFSFPAFPAQPEGYCHNFVMDPLPSNTPTALACGSVYDQATGLTTTIPCVTRPDRQAPFEVGDFIDYSGTLTVDPYVDSTTVNPYYISAHTVIAHVGIYTYPGTKPAYVAIEDLLEGTGGLPYANIPQEATTRVRVEGATTDPASIVDIYAMDVDQSTGLIKDRLLANVNPSGPPVIGRIRYVPAGGAFPPSTRNLRIVSRALCGSNVTPCTMAQASLLDADLQAGVYANGLVAGQYNAPNFEFIFPENLYKGDQILPYNFQDLAFLACGNGLLDPASPPSESNPVIGPLNPAPWNLQMPQQTAGFCLNSRFANVAPSVVNGGLSSDTVRILNATWDNRRGKGKLTITATSSAIAPYAPPPGLQLYVQADDGLPDPVTGAGYLSLSPQPMSMITQTSPIAPATVGPCGATVPLGGQCWQYSAIGTIVDPGLSCGDPNNVGFACNQFMPVQNVTIYSSYGGTVSVGADNPAILRLRCNLAQGFAC